MRSCCTDCCWAGCLSNKSTYISSFRKVRSPYILSGALCGVLNRMRYFLMRLANRIVVSVYVNLQEKISYILLAFVFYSKQEYRIRIFFLSDFDANNSSENFKMINEEYSKMLTCIQDTVFLHRSRKARNCNAALWQTLLGRTDQDRICLKTKKNRLWKSNSRHLS